MTEPYTGPKRRIRSQTVEEVEAAFDQALKNHEIREQEHFDKFCAAAFPDGPEAHKTAHQAMLDAARAEKEFWQGLKSDVAKRSIFGILQILVILLVAGLAAKLGLTAIVAAAIK